MSFWKNLGKGLLKVAPIAAGFIPGVGPLASMAIGGLAAGASKKLEGGSWKDSLISGGIGAGTGYGSAKMAQGLGKGTSWAKGSPKTLPSTSNIRNTALGLGPSVAKSASGAGGLPWDKIIGAGIGGIGALTAGKAISNQKGAEPIDNMNMNPPMHPRYSPDVGFDIMAGRRNAIANQPFRAGQAPFQRKNEETGLMEDMPGGGLPPIYPNSPRGVGHGGMPYRAPMSSGFQGGLPENYGFTRPSRNKPEPPAPQEKEPKKGIGPSGGGNKRAKPNFAA